MPKITSRGDVIQVLSEGQEEWLFLAPEGGANAVEATDHVLWITTYSQIIFYDIAARLPIGAIQLRDNLPKTLLSADRSRLFIVQTFREENDVQTHLLTVDPATAGIVNQCRLHGVSRVGTLRETPGGHLIANRSNAKPDDSSILWRIDPITGAAEMAEVACSKTFQGFGAPSPDGRYWLRADDRLARHVVRERKLGIFGSKETTYYSPVLQLWEIWPPRFLRWVPLGWVAEDEMPPLDGRWRIREPAEKARAWVTIADASEDAPADPTVGIIWPKPGLREQLAAEAFSRIPRPEGERAKLEDEAITNMIREWHGFVESDHRHLTWDLDSTGFWIQIAAVIRRVSVDGTISAGQYILQRGDRRDMLAFGSEALPGHRFLGRYNTQSMIFHDVGRGPARPTEVERKAPDWSEHGGAHAPDKALDARVETLRETRDRISVPLHAWSEAGVTAAMEALGRVLTVAPPPRSRDRSWVVFTHAGDEISEQAFFERVTAQFPGATQAIDHLIHAACDALAAQPMLLSQDYQVALLGHAAGALGVLDINALPTLRRYYSEMIDSEHETHFTLKTVLFIVQRHGWQRPMIEFVWWLLLQTPTNGLDDYASVWLNQPKNRDHLHWGMSKAVYAMYTPSQFAQLTSALGSRDGRADYSYSGVDSLLAHLSYRHDLDVEKARQSDVWLAEFFDLMDSRSARA